MSSTVMSYITSPAWTNVVFGFIFTIAIEFTNSA